MFDAARLYQMSENQSIYCLPTKIVTEGLYTA